MQLHQQHSVQIWPSKQNYVSKDAQTRPAIQYLQNIINLTTEKEISRSSSEEWW